MAKLSDGRCRRGFVLIPPQELSLRRQKSIHDKGHHPHAEAAWGASRERLLPGTGKQGSRLETPTRQRRNCTIGCGARRDNPAPFPELFLGRDTEVIAIDCKNLGWTGSLWVHEVKHDLLALLAWGPSAFAQPSPCRAGRGAFCRPEPYIVSMEPKFGDWEGIPVRWLPGEAH